MSKTTEPQTLADLELASKAAQRARAAAEKARDEAQAAVTSATTELDKLLAGLRAGDDSITTDDISRARTEIERRELLTEAAETVVQDAQWTESHAVATYHAERIRSGDASRAEHDKAVQTATTAVSRALQKLIGATRARADVIQAAKTEGIAAGLDQADPMSPVRITNRGRSRLALDGVEVEEISVVDAVQNALTQALADADINLGIEVTR